MRAPAHSPPVQGDENRHLGQEPEQHDVAIPRSTRHSEYYVQGEWRRHWMFASFDVTNRVVFNYDRPAGTPEDRQPSLNVIIGRQSPDYTYGDRDKPDIFLRYYAGVNPHGQFRSQRYFHIIGLGLHVRT